jgi:predicted secreted protein
MATTSPQAGKDVTLRLGLTSTATVITNLTSQGLSKTKDTREVTTKSSGTHKEYRPTFSDLTWNASGLFTESASTMGFEDLESAMDAGTLIYWEEGTGTAASPKRTGTGYIVGLNKEAPHDGNVEFSVDIQNTGDPVTGVYP